MHDDAEVLKRMGLLFGRLFNGIQKRIFNKLLFAWIRFG